MQIVSIWDNVHELGHASIELFDEKGVGRTQTWWYYTA